MEAQVNTTLNAEVIKEEEMLTALVPGEVVAILELIITDKDGNITEKRAIKSESFVRQFMDLLYIAITSTYTSNTYSIRDTGNVLRNCYKEVWPAMNPPFRSDAGAGAVTHGIVVGTGAVAPTINDYALGAIIAHGVGAGQLQYSAMTFGAPASDSTTSQFTLTRNFANGSGGAITVNEIGLYVISYDGGAKYFMAIRDVIAGGISVPNGQTLTVNYRIQAVV